MSELYDDNIKEQIDNLFAPSIKEPSPEPPTPIKEEKEPVVMDYNIEDMLYDLFENTEIPEQVFQTPEVAEPIEKPVPEEPKINFVEDLASSMSRVHKRTNTTSGQETISEEQLTLNNFQVQIDGIRRALRESTIVSGIGQGGDGQTPGSGEVKLAKLDDVNVVGIQDGETLVWNSTLNQFIPGVAVGGGGSSGNIDGGDADGNQSSRGDNPPSGDPIDLTGYATEVYVQNEIAAIPPVDLSGHATIIYVDDAIAAIPSVDLSDHATKVYVDDAIAAIPAPDFTGYATETYVTDAIAAVPAPDLSGYATETYVDDAVAAVPAPDFTGYATETYVDDAIENLGDILNFKGILDFTTNPQPDTFSAGDVYVNTGTGTPDASWSLSGDVSSGEMYGRGENQWGLIGSSGVDLTGYATETYVDDAVAAVPAPDFTGYATETYVDDAVAAVPVPDVSGYATESYVDDAVAAVPSADTSSLVKKSGDTMTGKLVLNNSSNAQLNFKKGGNNDIEYKGDWIVSFQGDSSPKVKLGAVIDMNSKKITNLASPTGDKDAVTKKYLEGAKIAASSNGNAKSGGLYYTGGRLYYKI